MMMPLAPLTLDEAQVLARLNGLTDVPHAPRLDVILPFSNGIRASLWSVLLTEADEVPAVAPLHPEGETL